MSGTTAIEPAEHNFGRWRWTRNAVAISALVGAMLIGALAIWVVSLPPLPLARAKQVSTSIIDRNGKLLRAYAMADGRWRLPVDAGKDVDPTYIRLLLAYEDRRFREHGGVDPLA